MNKNVLLAITGLLCVLGVSAQQTIKLHNVSIDEKTGMPRWAEVSTDQQVTETAFFQWFKAEYRLAPGIEFRLLRSDADNIGFVHNRYKQFFNGTEVMNALLIVHLKGGWVESFNGEYYRNFDQSIAGLTAEAARDRLLQDYGKVIFRWQVPEEEALLKKVTKNPDATWYPNIIPLVYTLYSSAGSNHIAIPCYAVHVAIAEPRQDEIVLLDIRNGKAVMNYPQEVHTDSAGKANTWYEGTRKITTDFLMKDSFRLEESGSRHVSTFKLALNKDFYDADNYWNNGSDRIAADIHWAGELVSDFMKKYFQKNSYDAKGGTITMVTSAGSGNAYWNLSSNYATFLVGSTSTVGPCAAVDVVGHEMGHGIADEISGLLYSGEGCSLHESFADINGHMTEIMADSLKANWWIGEKVWPATNGIRYIRDPWKFNNAKAYGGKYWPGGCHGDCGVQNYWFYIMVQGDTAKNEFGYSYKLGGLGTWKACQIHYRGYFYYMVPTGTFKDALRGSIKSARDLYGGCSNEIDYTFKAWKAVNVEDTSIKAVDLSHGIKTATLLCAGAPVNSTLASFGDLSRKVSWTIDYKDTSTLKSYIYNFKKTGQHNIALSTNTCGKMYYDSMKVIVNYKPDPKFTKPFDTACAGSNKVTFTNNTVNADKNLPLKYYWYVNPGAASDTTKDLKTSFPDGMDYEIQLKAYYDGGCWAIQKQTVTILQKPHPSFVVLKNVCQERELRLKNTSDTMIMATKFTWQFPDATQYKGYVPTTKTLKNYGVFNIILNADYLGGRCSDTAMRKIEIYQNPILDILYSNNCKNKLMTVIGKGKYAAPEQNSQWHFGISNPVNKDTFRLQLTDSTTRTIGYTAYDGNGCYATVYKTINIGYATAIGTVSSECVGTGTKLSQTSKADIAFTSKWDMGNATILPGSTINYLYPAAGKYTTKLIINTAACTDTQRISNEVYALPATNFTVANVCADKNSQFTNSTPDKLNLNHTWYFGDGDSSVNTDPNHHYTITKTTTYFVTLSNKDVHGCGNSITKTTTINELPKCDFSASLYQANPAAFTFKTNTINSGSTYHWYFGDGDSSILSEPIHLYPIPAKYNATVKIKNSAGCECTVTQSVTSGTNGVDSKLPNEIAVYPNPVHDVLYIENKGLLNGGNNLLKAELINSIGQVVMNKSIGSGNLSVWNISELAAGIYVLKLEFGGQKYYQKIVIE